MEQDAGLRLSDEERALLAGEQGAAAELAMRVIVTMAALSGARRLVGISSAHVDGCLYHGRAGLDFAERLAAAGGRVRVPTTLNVSSLDLLHPELVRLDPETRAHAARLMDAYVALGCEPTWTCAPYQLPQRPSPGDHVAWAESNAIVFANSVLGARTGRYGDFIDISAALTGRVPLAGLHLERERRARVVLHIAGLPDDAFASDELYALIGHVVGRQVGTVVPALVGLPSATSEDQLKALGAAAASSGAVALCHVVGVTPEAPTLDAALQGERPERELEIGPPQLRTAWEELSSGGDGSPLRAVSIGTPHFSLGEFERLAPLLEQTELTAGVAVYISTGRHVLAELERRDRLRSFQRAGVQLVLDTCTYVTPILDLEPGATVMTNSAKWAWYAPANLGVRVVFGTAADCLRSAAAGRVLREIPAWLGQ